MLPLVVQVERIDSHTADTCAFRKSPVRIGRNPLNDLVLEERYVSQWHAVIRFDGARVVYLDLGSTNPTTLNGQPVTRNIEIEIQPDADLRIGRLRLHLLRDQVPEEFFGMRRKSAFSEGPGSNMPNSRTTMYVPTRHSALDNSQASGGGGMAKVLGIPGSSAPRQQAEIHPRSDSPASAAVIAVLPTVAAGAGSHPAPADPSSPSPAPRQDARQSPPGASGGHSSVPPAGLSDSYAHYRAAWDNLLRQLRRDLEMHPTIDREGRVHDLQEQFPAISKEPQFRELMTDVKVDPLRSGEPEIADWFRRLTAGSFPPPGAPINQAMAMERVGAMLEVFAEGFVALRKAQEEFASAMSLRADEDGTSSMLSQLETSATLLTHLLDPGPGGSTHVEELRRALADLSLHHVGIVGAVVEGARALLNKLSPDEVAGDEARGVGMLGRFSRKPEGRKWHAFVQTFERLLEEDRFTRTLFGREFARRYYQSVAGRRPSHLPPRGR